MAQGFDPRVVGADLLRFLQSCQRHAPFHLGGGAALGGVYLRHRLSDDADLFFHEPGGHRDLVRAFGKEYEQYRSKVPALIPFTNHLFPV